MLLATLLDLEDVALGVAEVAPATGSSTVPFDLGDWLHTPSDKTVVSGFDVGDRVSDLVAGLIILRLTAALDELEHTSFTEVELNPARAGSQLGQPEHVVVEPSLRINVLGDYAHPAWPAHI